MYCVLTISIPWICLWLNLVCLSWMRLRCRRLRDIWRLRVSVFGVIRRLYFGGPWMVGLRLVLIDVGRVLVLMSCLMGLLLGEGL